MSRPIRIIVALTLALFAATTHAQTANIESVPPQSGGTVWTTNWAGGSYPSADAACTNNGVGTVFMGCNFTGAVPDLRSNYAAAGYMQCQYACPTSPPSGFLSGSVWPVPNAICPTPTINPTVPYQRVWNAQANAYMCERPAQQPCPVHSSGTFPNACVCDAGYKVDPVTQASCVPVVQCPEPSLSPLTDPIAIDFDNNPGNRWRPDDLTQDFQAKLTCVENGITTAGGSYVGTSAYRPTQYQLHLFEIVQKDMDLYPAYMSAHLECQALRDEITHEMSSTSSPPPPGHGLKRKQKVATPGKSLHESKMAFDLTPYGLTEAQMAPIYARCGVTHTAVSGEPWHTQ